jgi:hypothetical protein
MFTVYSVRSNEGADKRFLHSSEDHLHSAGMGSLAHENHSWDSGCADYQARSIIGESVCFAVYKSGKDSPIDICSITNYFDKYSALITHFKK